MLTKFAMTLKGRANKGIPVNGGILKKE